MKNLGLYKDNLDIPRKQDIDVVASRVSTNEDNIAMLDSDMETAQGDILTLKTNVTEVTNALTSKQDKIVGGASTITDDNLTANRALMSNGSGKVEASTVTSTELGHLSGTTSNVQTQIDAKVNKTDIPDNLVRYYDVSSTQAVVEGVNADTLEGHRASYFATASGLAETDTRVLELNSGLSTANSNISALQTAIDNKVNKSGDTMTGKLVAQNNTDYITAQVRNIIISTADPSGGNNGDIWIKYKA